MKKSTTTLLLALTFCTMPLVSHGQNDGSQILNVTEFTLLPGHEMQFIEGVKLWKECYKEHSGTDNFNVWKRFHGEGVVYVLTGFAANWVEMDKEDDAGKACRITAIRMIMPHVEKTNYSTARSMPEYSREPLEDTTLFWVYFFRVNNSTAFNEVAKELTSTTRQKEGTPRGQWFSYMGAGPDSPHFMVSVPYKGFPDLDVTRDGVWKVYESVHGKKKSDDLRAKWRSSIENSWDYLYTLNKEMSN